MLNGLNHLSGAGDACLIYGCKWHNVTLVYRTLTFLPTAAPFSWKMVPIAFLGHNQWRFA